MKARNVIVAMTIAVASLAVSVAPVLATDASPSPSPSTFKERMKERREERQENRQERRENISDRKSKRLDEHCTKVETNLTNFIGKVETRIATEKTAGKDVTGAESAVAEAKTALDSGKSFCDQSVAKYDSVPADQWSVQKPILAEARQLGRQAREQYMKTRVALAKALKALATN